MLHGRGADAGGRGGDGGGAGLGAEAELLGADEGHVGQPHEAEEVAKVGLLEVGSRGSALAVEAAAALDDDDALAGEKALGTLFGVAEGLAGAEDVVEPGAQRRRDAEVVHRRADDEDVGGAEFGDQRVGKGAGRVLGLGGGLGPDAGDAGLGEVGQGGGVEVAVDDLGRALGLQGLDRRADEAAGDRGVAGGGAVDDEKGAHWLGCPWFGQTDEAHMPLRIARR